MCRLPSGSSYRLAPPTLAVDHPETARCPESLCLACGVIASPGSCPARPRRALPLLHRSYGLMRQTITLHGISCSSLRSVVLAGCCQSLLGNGPSRRCLCIRFPGCLDPSPGSPGRCMCPLLPARRRPSPPPDRGSATAMIRSKQLRAVAVSRTSSFVLFRPSGLLATLTAPTVAALGYAAAVASTSGQNTSRYLPVHRIC